MMVQYENRREAGCLLALALKSYAGRSDTWVLALPRGGVPVGFEVARYLELPLDLLLVRKLGLPGQEELALGAIASGGVSVLNREVVAAGWVTDEAIEAIAGRERLELERREQLYRGQRPPPEVENQCVILVDDGAATGATLRACVAALRQRSPKQIVTAIPIGSNEAVRRLSEEADAVVCLSMPEPFIAVGRWYREFEQVTDAEVTALLARAWDKKA